MPDFSKLTGPAGAETNVNFLRTELARLTQQNQLLNQELLQRSAPRLPELCDALANLTALAAQGHPGAKPTLQRFFEIFDRAREASSALTVVRNGS